MGAINAVHLRGGPCDGERPEPLPGTGGFQDSLSEIAVMDHTSWVGHICAITADTLVDDRGVRRTVFDFERSVDGDIVKAGTGPGPRSP
jgi:hypothetical protein